MPYSIVADSLHTKKLCSRLSSSEVQISTENSRFAFFNPPLGSLGATDDDHLRLIGKRVVDFPLVLIEFRYSLRANIGSKSTISLQRSVEGVAPFFSED